MKPSNLRRYRNKSSKDAILVIGYDEVGRLISRLEKGGIVVATDMFVKLPNPIQLDKLGWTREQ